MGRKTLAQVCKIKQDILHKYYPYCMRYWSEFDYSVLSKVIVSKKKAGKKGGTYNDVIIMCDTETSKHHINKDENVSCVPNHVVAWTISFRAWDTNIATLYGQSPVDFSECIELIQNALPGDETFFYWHNMSYDWVFIRRFMIRKFGSPDSQLNTKPYYPIYVKWTDKGITFKDSLILAQRKLETWASDLNVEHKKAVGKWDYNKIRTQREVFKADELTYIENDTLAGVECIDATMKTLKKHIYSMPYTATGIPREEARKIGKKHGARDAFLSMALTYDQYKMGECVYHGGYTHGNRYKIERTLKNVVCYDFSSSYPAVMLNEPGYPCESFDNYPDCSMSEIIDSSDEYAFMFKLILDEPVLIDRFEPMPVLQFSKCVKCINPILDNGRILKADYIEIYCNDIDLRIIYEQYECSAHLCTNVIVAQKDYLPRWYTDYVYRLYYDKCTLKNSPNQVLYNIQKAKLNSLYGMCSMKAIRNNIVENYNTGEYSNTQLINHVTGEAYTDEELYQKYLDNNNTFLPYQWGIYITSLAQYNLFRLSKCCIDEKKGENHFCYCDTDSIYSTYWNKDKLNAYNDEVLRKLRANNYEPVEYEGQTFTPGLAEFDGAYSEFRVLGAKRYCCRYSDDTRNKEKNRGKLKITVAGVPKSGVSCLNDDIDRFTDGFIFPGEKTGKLTHHYIIADDIYTDEFGNLVGDSIDLTPCDYELSNIRTEHIDDIFVEEIELQVYE